MEFPLILNFQGLIIGLSTFIIIGLLHPLVVTAEYFWGAKSWRFFFIIGILNTILSVFLHNLLFSALSGILAFSFFWCIFEVFQQRKRVKKGWFPKNPKRKD